MTVVQTSIYLGERLQLPLAGGLTAAVQETSCVSGVGTHNDCVGIIN